MMENEIILPKENLDMAAADREQATKEMTNKDQGEVNREENLEEKLTTVLEALEKNLEEAIKEGIKTEEIKTEEIKEQPAEVIPGIIKDEEIKESQEISDAPDPRAGKLRATPAARRIAREFKVELQKVTGSGPNGRIETDDVKKLVVIQPGTFEYKSKEPVVIKTNLDNIVGNPKNLFSTPVKLEAIPEKAPRPRKKLKEMNHKIEKVPNPALDFVPFVDEDDERLKAEEAEVVTKISELDFVPFVDLKAEPLREEIIVKPTPMHLLYESEQEDLKRKSRGQQKRKPVQDESKATETSEQVVAEPTPEEKNTECQSSNIQAPELKENQPAHVLLETDEKEVLEPKVTEPKVTEPEKVKQMVEQKIEPEAAVAIVEKTDEIVESPAEISGATVQELTEEPEVTKDHHKKNAQESTEKNRVRTVRSKAINRYRIKNNEETPVISLTTEIDMTEIKELRKKITKKIEEQARYRCTYTDFLLLATSRALVTHPLINARREDDAVVAHAHVNMGLTVEAEHGFIVPVIPNTQSMSFVEIVKSRGDLLKAVKNNHLPEDQNSTFTITNLGMYGIREFTAIINQSNSAILSVGEVVQRIRIHQGEPVVRSVMKISLNLDQRVANGVDGAKFLRDIKADMENPSLLLF